MPSQNEIREDITSRIADAMRAGQAPWRRPWNSDPNCGFPTSFTSGKRYRGINPLLLALTNDYTSRWWATYRGWQQAGGQVRKGSRRKDRTV